MSWLDASYVFANKLSERIERVMDKRTAFTFGFMEGAGYEYDRAKEEVDFDSSGTPEAFKTLIEALKPFAKQAKDKGYSMQDFVDAAESAYWKIDDK